MKKLFTLVMLIVTVFLTGCATNAQGPHLSARLDAGLGTYSNVPAQHQYYQQQRHVVPAYAYGGYRSQSASQYGRGVRIQEHRQTQMVPVCNRGGSYDPVRKLCVVK